MSSIVGQRFMPELEDAVDVLLEAESSDYVVTVTLTVEEAWRLSRELARTAAAIEINREARLPAP